MTGPSDGMFDPFTDDELREAERSVPADKSEDPQPIVPAPADAPELDWSRLRPREATGEPVKIWLYHMGDGEFAFYVVRWEPKDPKEPKIVRPVTWCRFPDGRERWALKAMPAPRPLHSLPAIIQSPDKPVVVTEGEKCADAAADVFLDHAVTTWAGGSGAWRLADWEPLAGRDVLLLADADDPGREAMRQIAEHLASRGCTVRVHLPSGDGGRDIADWLEEDSVEATRAWIEANAKVWEPKADVTADAGDSESWQEDLIERIANGDLDAIAEPETVDRMRDLKRSSELNAQLLRAKLLDVPRVRAGLVDAAFGSSDRGDDDNLQGRPVVWPEVEPWPEAVDGAALLAELARLFRHYVSLPDGGAEAAALWALYTWVFEAFGVCPNLMATAPERESGKTRVTELLSWMVWRPKLVSDASAAAIIRGIARDKPTLLIDEAQHFLKRRAEDTVRGILLASFAKRGANVERCVGDDHETRLFSTFAPKAMNGRNLAAIDDMLTSRSVVLPMTRARKRYPNLRADRDPVGEDVHRMCARWRDDHLAVLQNAEPDMDGMFGRIADVWRPLYAVADTAGGDWPALARRSAQSLVSQTNVVAPGESLGVQLLRDCRLVFEEHGNPDYLPTSDLDRALFAMAERPWKTLSNGNAMTVQRRGNLLGQYGIKTDKVRHDGKPTNIYWRSLFESAWESWL